MKMIVVVDEAWGIGKDNDLLNKIPEDLARFKKMTEGNIVIMGRKTLESLPGGKPLPNRVNIILTRDPNYKVDGAIVLNDTENINLYINAMKAKENKEAFVIGGAEIYNLLLPLVTHVYATKMWDVYEADTFFTNLDKDDGWLGAPSSGLMYFEGTKFQYHTYHRPQYVRRTMRIERS